MSLLVNMLLVNEFYVVNQRGRKSFSVLFLAFVVVSVTVILYLAALGTVKLIYSRMELLAGTETDFWGLILIFSNPLPSTVTVVDTAVVFGLRTVTVAL